MRILQLRASDFFGSPERLILGQVKALNDFEFVCASFVRRRQHNQFLNECTIRQIRTASIGEMHVGDIRAIINLRHLVKSEKVDLVISHDYKSHLYSYLALGMTSIRHIAYFHGFTNENFKVRLYNFVDILVMKRIAAVVTVSSATKKHLCAKGLREDKVYVVPNAMEVNVSPSVAESDILRSGNVARVVAVGRLSYEKGFDILLKSVAHIVQYAPPFMLSIYGSGPEEARLKSLAHALRLIRCVTFCGVVDSIVPVFRNMDFLVMPSRSEGMPFVILEAWSQRLGVLATKVGGIPEMIVSGENGVLVPPEDIPALSNAMLACISDVSLMKECGRRGFQSLTEHYTLERQALLLRDVIGSVAH